ncbi:MAG: GerMN domain-containing protein [Actinomycetota bacterium]|nr:GerMN domain-containing protein [Actinomycetota bacterium]
MSHFWLRTGLAFIIIIASACGPPSGPVEIPAEDVPFSLRRPRGAARAASEKEKFHVFFVRERRLAAVRRMSSSDGSGVRATMRALLEGPTLNEREERMRSEIPSRTSLLGVRVVNFVAEVDLSAEFQTPAPPDAVLLRVAQVVWTLVRLPNVTAVRFLIDGEPISVVTDDRTVVDRPVTAPDYSTVAPREAE